jgi:hypothetical protein
MFSVVEARDYVTGGYLRGWAAIADGRPLSGTLSNAVAVPYRSTFKNDA